MVINRTVGIKTISGFTQTIRVVRINFKKNIKFSTSSREILKYVQAFGYPILENFYLIDASLLHKRCSLLESRNNLHTNIFFPQKSEGPNDSGIDLRSRGGLVKIFNVFL